MSGVVDGGGGGKKGAGSPDFDLNIAPIIDCFTVLITFMLASASFLSIGILDAGAGSSAPAENASQKPLIAVQVELQSGFAMQVKLTGKASSVIPLPGKDGKWDHESLVKELTKIKAEWPQTDSVTLSAVNDVQYKHLMGTLENVRKIFPGVLLGGF